MGNYFAGDLDEENVKLMFASPQKLDIKLSFNKAIEIEASGRYYYTIKMPVSSLWDEDNRKEMRENFINQIMINQFNIDFQDPRYQKIHLTGNGVEIHSSLIEYILKERLIMKDVKYKKHHHIPSIWKGIVTRLAQDHQFLYHMPAQSIVDIHKVRYSEELSPKSYIATNDLQYPLLLVNLKSGISFFTVSSPYFKKPTKVMGSIFGEATLSGLLQLLENLQQEPVESSPRNRDNHSEKQEFLSDLKAEECGKKTPSSDLMREAMQRGNSLNVDLLVGDIYGENSMETLNMPPTLLASSMGKSKKQVRQNEGSKWDYMKSVIMMLAINLSHITSLVAKFEKVKSVLILPNQFDCEDFNCLFNTTLCYYAGETMNQKNILFADHPEVLGSLGILAYLQNLSEEITTDKLDQIILE